jgi:CheY-like chemotaxis protein
VPHDDSTAASLGAIAAQTGGAAAEVEPGPVVLLVAADAAKRRVVRAALTPLGHPMVEASSGRAALRAVAARRFAVILTDVRMPTMSGYEAAKRIRARSDSALTPIIFMTAFGATRPRPRQRMPAGRLTSSSRRSPTMRSGPRSRHSSTSPTTRASTKTGWTPSPR